MHRWHVFFCVALLSCIALPCFATENTDILDQLILTQGVDQQYFDHAQVLIGKADQVLYHHTYHLDRGHGLYDIASLSKVVATAPAFWRLVDKGIIEPEVLTSPLRDVLTQHSLRIPAKDLLSQQAPLRSGYRPLWIPWSQWKQGFTSSQVAQWKSRYQEELQHPRNVTSRKRQYSDLAYYYVQKIIEEKTQLSLDEVVYQEVFEPFEMNNTRYGAELTSSDQANRCVPNLSQDNQSRCRVHDPMCSLLGGVCGNAGVFSNALDLGKFISGWMQDYPGDTQVTASHVTQYDLAPKRTRESRGRNYSGWKTAHANSVQGQKNYVYFHEGFTGTTLFMDPTSQMYYVFLANASHKQRRLGQLHANQYARNNFRDRIHYQMLRIFQSYIDQPVSLPSLDALDEFINIRLGKHSPLQAKKAKPIILQKTPQNIQMAPFPVVDLPVGTNKHRAEALWNGILSLFIPNP